MRLPFRVDIGRGLFALGLAVLVYFVAVNETNPEGRNKTSFTVPVVPVNVPTGLVVTAAPAPVNLWVRAPVSVFNSRLRSDSFTAQVDASGAQAGDNDNLPISVNWTDPDVRDATADPGAARLHLEEVRDQVLPVRVNLSGTVPPGYQQGQPTVDPPRVVVTGASSLVGRASEAVVDVNIDRVTVSVNGVYTPRIVDDRGNDLRDLNLRPQPPTVTVQVPITQQTLYKEVGVRPVTTGQPAAGYALLPLEVNPPTVTLVGEPAVLQDANFVDTAPIDINGISSTVVRSVPLVPPPRTLLLQQNQTVTVTVRVTTLTTTQTVRVPASPINLSGAVQLARAPDLVSVTLSGPAPALSNLALNPNDFKVIVDAAGKGPGHYDLDVKVTQVPAGLKLEDFEPKQVPVDLREAPATPTPVPVPTPSPVPPAPGGSGQMPIVALVGRPNVGKSTLFNRLIGEHRAVVHEQPGTTRDRLYGTVEWRSREFTVIDTGGIGLETGDGDLLADVRMQAEEAMRESDVIVWVVDASTGLTAADHYVADHLRPSRKPVILCANKAENQRRQMDAVAEFSSLGFGEEPILISALHGEGTGDLLDAIVEWYPRAQPTDEIPPAVSIAIVGRPNVGKSSLVNGLLGRPRAIVRDEAGTTRDAIDTPILRDGQTILLIDTAGIRRRGRIQPGVEKFSVLRAVRAIERADVAVLLIDATEGMLAQDTHVAGYVDEAAKGLIVAVNKWDLVEKHPKTQQEYTQILRRELKFADWAPVVYISAKTGQRVDRVVSAALAIQAERTKRVPTPRLNNLIRRAVDAHPLSERGKQMKIYYTAQTGSSPPKFTCFVNDPKMVHFSYVRYLENTLRGEFAFEGTPLRIEFRGRNDLVRQ